MPDIWIGDVKMRTDLSHKKTQEARFTASLLEWNKRQNDRQMPWKGEKDPYKIWLSEIILQQTRVDQGLAYYQKFVAAFPTINSLAIAPEGKIFKLWEGLGYYSRCRNLISTAQIITKEKAGRFPDTYEEIKSLKGIGPYTAAAIASFAFNKPYAVVDGNVYRVLSRVFGIDIPIDSTEGKKAFSKLAENVLDKKKPALYNQAIMDFGATVCKPVHPLCDQCPCNLFCIARKENRIDTLPVKQKKTRITKRWFYFIVMEHNQRFVLRQRIGRDIWSQLYEFPLVETNSETEIPEVLKKADDLSLLPPHKYSLVSISPEYKQVLSHQHIRGRFIHIRFTGKESLNGPQTWVNRLKLKNHAFPKLINQYLEKDFKTN